MIIKNSVSVFFLSIFSSFFIAPNLHAATGFELNPQNLPTVLDQIVYHHDTQVEVPISKVEIFLQDHITGPTYFNFAAPDAQLISTTANAITFEWDKIGGADMYIARYMNLETSEIQTFTVTDDFVTFNVPNDNYIFTFQSKTNSGKKGLTKVLVHKKGVKFIIIEDKPLSSVVNPDNCDCYSDLSSSNSVIGLDEVNFYDFPSGEIDNIYRINVRFGPLGDPNYISDYYVRIMRNASDELTIGVYNSEISIGTSPVEDCTATMDMFELENSFLYALNPDIPSFENEYHAIRFGFGNNGLDGEALNSSSFAEIQVKECGHNLLPPTPQDRKAQPTSNAVVKMYPNPSSDVLKFNFDQFENPASSIAIKNSFGQIVQYIEPTSNQEIVNITHLPIGIYYAEIIIDAKREVLALVKTE